MSNANRVPAGLLVAAILSISAGTAGALPLESLANSVQEFTLDNGLRFLVVERHDAPVFSYATCVKAGGVNEVPGITGIAHMFEHMAFKGTATIGTVDAVAEAQELDRVDKAWAAVLGERHKGFDVDSTRLAELTAAFKGEVEAAEKYVVSNEYSQILEANGARGLNAFTSTDQTCYHYSLPSNRTRLWARMEGDRLTHPVLREFYKEREVVRNERRIGTESTPTGRLFEDFLTTAFSAHPYGNGVIGHTSDIQNFSRQDALDFFRRNYVAKNMTVCVVGDVTADQVHKLAKDYFADVSAGPAPGPVVTVEPVHRAERRVIAQEEANPVLMIGWQGPASRHPDYAATELVMEILGTGRSSRLYTRLVKEEQVATQVGAGTDLPGREYPNLAVVFVFCAADRDPLEAEALIYEEVDRLIKDGPTPEEVAKVKAGYLARTMRQLREPSRLAVALASSDQLEGDWHYIFEHLGRIETVTAADIQRVAGERLTRERRTVAVLEKKPEAEQ